MWQGLFQSHGNICEVEIISVLCGLLAVKGCLANFLKPSAAHKCEPSHRCVLQALRWGDEPESQTDSSTAIQPSHRSPSLLSTWKTCREQLAMMHTELCHSFRDTLFLSLYRVHIALPLLYFLKSLITHSGKKKKVLFCLQNLMC